jgi:hypothetical protein
MKFEPLIPMDAKADAHALAALRPAARFTFEHAPFAGQSFAATFRICDNPCCPCGGVGFLCRPETAPDHVLSFDLDVFERQINMQVQSAPDGAALGRAFVTEAQDAQWEWLRHLFLNAKRLQMEMMDLDTLAADLPADVKGGGGTMVAYAEIFPWAELLEFKQSGAEWFVDDQYCVRPGCDCTEAGLAFFRGPQPGSPGSGRKSAPSSGEENQPAEPRGCATFFMHDYITGRNEVLEVQPGTPAPDALLQSLRAAHPSFAQTLAHRRRQMRQLGRRLMPQTRRDSRHPFRHLQSDGSALDESEASPPPAARSAPKPGRNDPCPCGSGKKFKKCCGAA